MSLRVNPAALQRKQTLAAPVQHLIGEGRIKTPVKLFKLRVSHLTSLWDHIPISEEDREKSAASSTLEKSSVYKLNGSWIHLTQTNDTQLLPVQWRGCNCLRTPETSSKDAYRGTDRSIGHFFDVKSVLEPFCSAMRDRLTDLSTGSRLGLPPKQVWLDNKLFQK